MLYEVDYNFPLSLKILVCVLGIFSAAATWLFTLANVRIKNNRIQHWILPFEYSACVTAGFAAVFAVIMLLGFKIKLPTCILFGLVSAALNFVVYKITKKVRVMNLIEEYTYTPPEEGPTETDEDSLEALLERIRNGTVS